MRILASFLLFFAISAAFAEENAFYDAEELDAYTGSTEVPSTTEDIAQTTTHSAGTTQSKTEDPSASTQSTTTSAPTTTTTVDPAAPTTTTTIGPSVPSSTATAGSGSTSSTSAPTTTTTVDSFKMQTVTFPNPVSPPDGKLLLQKTIALSNHVNQLTAQIAALQLSIDPENSPLITNLQTMANQTDGMLGELATLQQQLTDSNSSMEIVYARYNNASRVFSCFTQQCSRPTTTVEVSTVPATTTPFNCNLNFNASTASQTYNFQNSSDVSCSQTISADLQSHVYFNVSATIIGSASLTFSDLITGTVIKTLTASGSSESNTSTTSVKISVSAGAKDWIAYTLVYSSINPCYGFCDASAKCVVSNGIPYCTCEANNPCINLGSDQKSCVETNACTTNNKKKCDKDNHKICVQDSSKAQCYSCQYPATTLTPDGEDEDYFARWSLQL